jgi:hypothetical protein
MSNVRAMVPESRGPWEITVAAPTGAVLGPTVGDVWATGLAAGVGAGVAPGACPVNGGLGVGGMVSSTVTPGSRTRIQPGRMLLGR